MLSINECIDILDVTINNYERLAQSSEAWQTLKTAVLAQQTTNTASTQSTGYECGCECQCACHSR